MKAILMSIQPRWCELIANGTKTIEVRKTAPKEVPFKVYIYQTKKRWIYKLLPWLEKRQAKVVGEFICNRVSEHEILDSGAIINYWAEGLQHSCLTISQIDEYVGKRSPADYGKKSKIYGWHISDLKIYDKPKELSEFRKPNFIMETVTDYNQDIGYDAAICDGCYFASWENKHLVKCADKNCEFAKLYSAPQSWQYVEEL